MATVTTRVVPPLIDPSRTAVLVVDKQRAYLDPRLEKPWPDDEADRLQDFVRRLDAFLAEARRLGILIVFTRMVESLTDSPRNIRAVMAAGEEATSLCEPGLPAYEWFGEAPADADWVIDKAFYDAFAGTSLAGRLRAANVETVVLVGAFAGRCVLGTAFGANGHGFDVVLVPDLVIGHPGSPHELEVVTSTVSSILGGVHPTAHLAATWNAE